MALIDSYQKYKKEINIFGGTVILVFLIKLLFSFLPGFGYDMSSWFGWAGRLNTLGFAKFYSETDWTQYTPGYMYWLYLIGRFGWTGDLAIKLPVILADIATGALIWSLVRKTNKNLALISFILYTLNPVVIFDGSVWGQIDGLLTFFLFTSAYFLIEKKNFPVSVLLWSAAFLIKPQSIAVAPAFLLAILSKKFDFKTVLKGGILGAFFIFIFSLPFFPNDPILGLPHLIIRMGSFYSYTSVNAFNIWSWAGFWRPDTVPFLGVSLATWGALMLAGSIVFALFVFRKKIDKKSNYYLLFAVLSLCFFLFPTKVHERYVFPFFAFLIASGGISGSITTYYIYVIASVGSFFNLYYPYAYYNKNFLFSQGLYTLSESLSKLIGGVYLAIYPALLFLEKLPKLSLPRFNYKTSAPAKLSKIVLSSDKSKLILGAILLFALFTRTYSLDIPRNEYFDEVYHAFTAKVMMNSDKAKAWEWWNTPPAGFAYEWTHPPLAKLGMVLGMSIFGQLSFGWRIVGAVLGVGSVYLIYLLTKELFNDEVTALMAAGVFSLDGLALVMSRIGMNDSYLLFFSLLSIYLFMKEKDIFAAVSFGLALASKWSAIWVLPILGVIFLSQRKKFKKGFLWFFILPPVIYLSSYLQMFLTNHDLSVWWEMQQQMWWYHTGLKATHPYSSQWWSWPLLIRPIYLYTSDEIGGMVGKIYAMGNPLVFWFGLSSVLLSCAYSFVEKNKKLGIVVFSYLIFFAPWALSPRIMFMYHYLPSVPFLAIATGYVLRRNAKLIVPFFVSALVLFVYFYPHWTGIQVPVWLDQSYYWVNLWR